METYESLLDNIYKNLPKRSETEQRFEFPEFNSLIEGNKTIIRNFEQVASKLRRTKEIMVKFFSKELATPIVSKDGLVVLQRKVNPNVLNSKLQEFIKDYVLCKSCKKPDTNILSSGNVKEVVCEACGSRRPVK